MGAEDSTVAAARAGPQPEHGGFGQGSGERPPPTAYPGAVKAWHYHKKQVDNFVVVKGMMKVVLYDSREGSPTFREINEFFMGEHNPILLQIPSYVYHGFKCISEEECIILNIVTECYNHKNPDEYRKPPHNSDIPYDWARKDG